MALSYKLVYDEGRQGVAKTFLLIGYCLMNNSYIRGHAGVAVEICFFAWAGKLAVEYLLFR